jgi:hypothetical protein
MITSDTRKSNYHAKATKKKQKAAKEAKLIPAFRIRKAVPARGSSSAAISLAEAVRSG